MKSKTENLSFTPVILLSINSLRKLFLIDIDSNNKESAYTVIRKQLKDIFNYRWDNSILGITDGYGVQYTMSIYTIKNKHGCNWSINFWDQTGSNSIYEFDKEYISDADMLTSDEIMTIKKHLEDFTKGIKKCNGCGTSIPTSRYIAYDLDKHKKKYGGQYFAARYCIDCWENKYKAIEAAENYN
ncbi:hypothetical protein LCGC14_1655700 [marine sediment metagenome]|uniref:Uncharacterized protein n=1 Tax=marine sediment metagenome TaxID=412755 RepID=A0A0F9II25_9ZZZZ